jgi:hypothetical protein
MDLAIEYDPQTPDELPFSLRPLYFAFSFQTAVINFATHELELLEEYDNFWKAGVKIK